MEPFDFWIGLAGTVVVWSMTIALSILFLLIAVAMLGSMLSSIRDFFRELREKNERTLRESPDDVESRSLSRIRSDC